ncbi:MAG: hypothetical protein K9H65_03875 [Bacteroidales bacterium]|nr:hypothetical protein [Bacteroidales bacterium]
MKNKKIARIIPGFFIGVFLVILGSFLIWFFKPKKELEVFLLNKTVPTEERIEHKSFYWVLNNNRYVKSNHERYKFKKDYYGFFPINPGDKQFDFKSVSNDDVEQISDNADIAYYADTYGVYYSEWYQNSNSEMRGEEKVYGGLNRNDYLLLKAFMEKGKTIITEFVLLNKTTSPLIRSNTEDLLQFTWEGWIGRYFHSLDVEQNPGLPGWIVDLYEEQKGAKWNFKHSGIVLIHRYGTVIVLDSSEHLTRDVPIIQTKRRFAEKYQLPLTLEYPYWFDIVKDNKQEEAVANFELSTNSKGDSLLTSYNVSSSFPAIINHSDNYNLYYFAGDFCQNPIDMGTSYFSGIQLIDFLFYSETKADRTRFFWKYYIPLMKGILEDTHTQIN